MLIVDRSIVATRGGNTEKFAGVAQIDKVISLPPKDR